MIGQTLSHYRLTSSLGAGGMGQVYRATDTTLGRDVAVKVLLPEVAQDAERCARFEREARLLASLNHPNIAHVYGFEASAAADGSTARFLVMELVDGEDLSERLTRGPLPLDEAVECARQIAEALAEAHARGIVHRDLKPANIKLTPEGRVKVLDFGLARAFAGETASDSSSDLSQSPTLAHTGTQAGVILGTAAYMSPEQARGKPVDERADIWAFGVVLYEMLTGRPLFAGETVSDILAAVLTREPDLGLLPATAGSGLRRLLRRCLARDPRDRLRAAADARLELDEIGRGVADESPSAPAAGARGGRREAVAWLAAALLAAAVAVLVWRSGPDAAFAPQVIRATLPLPPGVSIELEGVNAGMPVLSPDGRRLAFGAREGAGPTRIWVLELASGAARPLTGTEGGYRPFWSPDGRSIGFFTWGHLLTIPAEGGAVNRLAVARDARGGTWNSGGTILFSPFATGPLYSVPEGGGAAREVTGASASVGGATHRFPQFLPDGEHFLYLDRPASLEGSGVVVGRLGSAEPVSRLLELAANAIYSEGHVLFVRDGALLAQPFDPDRLTFTGEPEVLVADVLFNQRFSYGVFSASRVGTLAFLTGRQSDLSELVWRDRSGRRLGRLGTAGVLSGAGGFSLSPDGRLAAVTRIDEGTGEGDIWVYDLSRGTETRLARPGEDENDPIFAPDGRALYYGSRVGDTSRLVRLDIATGEETTLRPAEMWRYVPGSVSADGALISYGAMNLERESDLRIESLSDAAETRALAATPADETYVQISPDDRFVAWASDESGRYEIYVARFPEGSARVQVSREGGTQPRWNPRGGELFFKAPDNTLTVVAFETASGSFAVGEPQRLFQIVDYLGWTYAVASDGQRLLVREPLGEEGASPLTLLTNWPAALMSR